MNGETLKLVLRYLWEKPSCIFCLIALWGASVMYQDNREFINEQQIVLREISATQTEIQKALIELNIRVQNLESKNQQITANGQKTDKR